MLPHPTAWAGLPEHTIAPGYHARFIHASRMTFALWRVEPDAALPHHDHPHEQVTHILEGEFELVLDGVTHLLKAGDVLVIPPHAKHGGKALTPCMILDVFSPVREDYVL